MRRKALSLRQPWAWAIFYCGKDVENRTWETGLRGRVVIHASKTFDMEGWEWLRQHGYWPSPEAIFWNNRVGCLVGEVTITGCRRPTPLEEKGQGGSPWAFGPWCFELEGPKVYRQPIPARGYPGFFWVDVPEEEEG